MPTEHRRRTDGNGAEVHERVTDRDLWARAEYYLTRFKLLWVLALPIIGWFGNKILEPLESVKPLEAQVAINASIAKANFDTLKARLDTADINRNDMSQVLKVFGKFICKQMTSEERYQYEIRCKDLPTPTMRTP